MNTTALRFLSAALLLTFAACSYAPYPRAMYAMQQEEQPPPPGMNTERYERIDDNPFFTAKDSPLSTFSIDVDTASYANVRRFLEQGSKPPKDAVRIEELINYFNYKYPAPTGTSPFAVHAEVFACPWEPAHQLVKLGLKGREIDTTKRPAANLVFLLDVSGSMDAPNKLPLLKTALQMLTTQLREDDRVAIVVYAGASGLALPSTPGSQRGRIISSLEELQAGGSTNGAAGIQLAYRTAEEHFIKGGINRVILATDGDFNVGVSSDGELSRLVEEKAKTGVALTVLGFGMGNYNDSMLEKLADRGNGNYAYVDSAAEAKKVLVEQASGTLLTIAKDVKIQVEFNPSRVQAYRLIGYENRLLRSQDFNDDQKDAGELGAGHTVTALYEVVPVSKAPWGDAVGGQVDALKYQKNTVVSGGDELMTVKLRFKAPDANESQLMSFPIRDATTAASSDAHFAAAVAEFGMLLRDSPFKSKASYAQVQELASSAAGDDQYRREFLALVKRAQGMAD
ncbi:MAG: VWA domain-containing protein [Archangium sp.]|nr:VWA domain-containing protein [Archangium sp.]